jgi:hypothetical protein
METTSSARSWNSSEMTQLSIAETAVEDSPIGYVLLVAKRTR